MNTDIISGKVDQLKGHVKQSIGEATNNDKLANSGVADQVKGHAKEAWGATKDAASSVSTDAKIRAEREHEYAKANGKDTTHNVREGVVSTAESVKNFVTGHADHVKHDH